MGRMNRKPVTPDFLDNFVAKFEVDAMIRQSLNG
jgi:hypothetical protein